MNVSQWVEPDRVHRRVYTDQQIFDREMTQIFERVWVYCGHQTQVPQSILISWRAPRSLRRLLSIAFDR